MNPLDRQVEAVIAMLRAAGGNVGMDKNATDFAKMAFLKMILECPDCREVMGGNHEEASN